MRAKSPNAMVLPPLEGPLIRPRCCLRCLTRRGINMSRPSCRRSGRVARRRALGEHIAAIDPDLDADGAVGGPGQDLAVGDVRAQGAQRDASLLLPLAPRHLRAAEATRDGDLDALGTGLHGPLDGLLDGLAEGDPT